MCDLGGGGGRNADHHMLLRCDEHRCEDVKATRWHLLLHGDDVILTRCEARSHSGDAACRRWCDKMPAYTVS